GCLNLHSSGVARIFVIFMTSVRLLSSGGRTRCLFRGGRLPGIWREFAVPAVGRIVFPDLGFVDFHADAWLLDPAPAGPISDGQAIDQDVVLHHLRRLLMPKASIGCGEHQMMEGGGGDAELAMGMLAELPALHMADL